MNQNLFKIGLSLLCLGLLLAGWTLIGLQHTYDAAGGDSATAAALAEEIETSVSPMMVGMPAIILGVVLLLIHWWRNRRRSFLEPLSSSQQLFISESRRRSR